PCLVGLLVGSNFKKSVRYTVYSIFIFYLIINLLSGDRGSWVYDVILLLFLSHTFYKKFKWKQILSGSVFVFFFLHLIDVIIDLRKTSEISISNFKDSFTFKDSPVVNFVFEMGASMKPVIVLIQNGWDIWPY